MDTSKLKFTGTLNTDGKSFKVEINAENGNIQSPSYKITSYESEYNNIRLEKVKDGTSNFHIVNSKFDTKTTKEVETQLTTIIVEKTNLIK
jgi:hypothetical protein